MAGVGHRLTGILELSKQENATVILLPIYITHQKNQKTIIKFEIFFEEINELKFAQDKKHIWGNEFQKKSLNRLNENGEQ